MESHHVENLVNGVTVERLVETIAAGEGQPHLALFTFRARTDWAGGGRGRASIQGFFGAGAEDASRYEPLVLEADEPPVLLGKNAVEALLRALGSWLVVGFAYNAAAQGIPDGMVGLSIGSEDGQDPIGDLAEALG